MPITPNGRRRSVAMGKYSKHCTDDCNLCTDTSRSFQDERMAAVTVKFVHPNPQLIHFGLPFCLIVHHYAKQNYLKIIKIKVILIQLKSSLLRRCLLQSKLSVDLQHLVRKPPI